MTSDNETTEAGSGAQVPVRRRMGGYTPLPQQDVGVPAGGTDPAADAAASPAPVRTPDLMVEETAVHTATPVRKTRMGGGPAAAGMAESAPADPAGGPAPAAPVRKTRMGGGPAAPTLAEPAPAVASVAVTEAPATAPSVARTRLGGAPPIPVPEPADGGAEPPASDGRPAGRPGWLRPALSAGALVVLALGLVLAARGLRSMDGVQGFIALYDGHASQPGAAPTGIPAWLGWQHFLNMFFIVLIVRTGLQVRNERKPPAYWTARKGSFFSPAGNTPKKVSLSQWLHQCLDVLWVVNGAVFVVMLLATGQWKRIVPGGWDIFPHMASAALQYASLNWPVEDGWAHYNALQVMAYFLTVFVAAPLAVLSGIRMSTWWPDKFRRLNKVYPVEWARAVHFPVMLYFVAFTVVHVFLVFFTGALANLNHMYTSRDAVDWWGLVVFLASVAVIAAAWFLTRPLFTTPVAKRTGTVTKN